MDSTLFRSLEWRCIGPHRGGRVVAVAGHPTEYATFYYGGVAGGSWKTPSGGALWENISDGQLGTAAIGALAVAPSAPHVIYAGTGEATIRGNVSHGDGVYVSRDGGHSWRNTGLAESPHIGDIVVHPTNADIPNVAALGHAWAPNDERGVHRTDAPRASRERPLYTRPRRAPADPALSPPHP